jgi:hypothetical protein
VRKEEIIEDLNRKLRRSKMDENAETNKVDDDNCSHASTLSTMSHSSNGSSILASKLNSNHDGYGHRSKNLKNEGKSK